MVTLKQWMYLVGLHIAIMMASPVLNYCLILDFSFWGACLSTVALSWHSELVPISLSDFLATKS